MRRWSRKIRQARIVISKSSLDRELVAIAKLNGSLHQFTTESDFLSSTRSIDRKDYRGSARNIKVMRRYYSGLYRSLEIANFWQCPCKQVHAASVQLDARRPQDERHEHEHANFGSKYFDYRLLTATEKFPSSNPGSAQALRAFEVHPRGFDGDKIHSSTLEIAEEKTISSVCEMILSDRHMKSDVSLGFLPDEISTSLRHSFFPVEIDQNVVPTTLSSMLQKSVLTDPRGSLLRKDRLFIAATLASGVLQIGETDWLHGFWSSNDVFLLTPAGGELRNLADNETFPYFNWVSSIAQGDMGKSFGLPREAESLIRSRAITALGMTLVELCLGKTLSDLQSTCDEATTPLGARLVTAQRLLDEVELQEGNTYRRVVDKCLHSNFDVDSFLMDGTEFQQILCEEVIEPLYSILDDFQGSKSMKLKNKEFQREKKAEMHRVAQKIHEKYDAASRARGLTFITVT